MAEDLEEKYYHTLDKEEREILDAYNKGEFESVPNVGQEKKKAVAAAKATISMRKNKNVNIRISERDLYKIKVKAAAKGLPYQTLVSSILHQYSNDKVKELA